MFREYNPNPVAARVGDCAVRAVAKATGQTWEEVYIGLTLLGYLMGDMPNANSVWGAYLRKHRFTRHILPNECPECYTVRDFAHDHSDGVYVVAVSNHVVAVCGGDVFDSWDSSGEIPTFYWERGE